MTLRPFCMFLLCAAAFAQDPQLVWEGEVDGTVLLRIHGSRIGGEERAGLPVQRQRFRFYERLPDARVDVRLDVVQGRGRVRIVEQPRPENNYTLAVSIEDRDGGSSFYSLAFFWDADRRAPAAPQGGGSFASGGEGLTWSGRVDDEVVVSCRRDACESETLRGGPATRERVRFTRPLPAREVTVSLEQAEGRGDIRLIQQPREENGYTARVRIRDSQGGSSDYAFALTWQRPPREDAGFSFSRPGMTWAGRVDGRVRVIVEGNRATSEVVSGAPVTGERAAFARALAARDNPNATVRRVRGRGRVEIVEYPSRRNGYRLVFEIDDSSGGSDQYEIEVGW